MTYKGAESYIHSFTRFGSQLGLERMKKLLNLMGNPQDKLKFIHIAGTNGKGSTVKMSSTILETAGYKVGMYISPFVIDFRERFQINSKMIEKSDFARLVEYIDPYVKQLAQGGDQVTEFEVITAIAFKFFEQNKCDVVCLEVGLGGQYDATNVIKTPIAAIITSISLDHTEILGDTITKIAGEKAGIIKVKTDVVTYPLQEADAVAVFMEVCAKTKSRLILPNKNAVSIVECGVLGSKFIYDGVSYSIKLAGIHQIYNAVAVIEAMKVLRGKSFAITDEDIKTGLKKSKFPARFEIMSKNPLIIVDGAHNKQAAESLGLTLQKLTADPKVAIMGMMADKDFHSAVGLIANECKSIITIPVDNPRAIDEVSLANAARDFCSDVYPMNDYNEALHKALDIAGEKGAVIICGSFYMASDMRKNVKSFLKAL
ncbi:MAG: folylpolyglutamate synthase/dihydrofolate synthase family protein [Oscillospiraceae bacterium]